MPIFGFIGGIGPTELILVLVIVLVLFGAGRLPQVFEQFGKGIKSFRDAQREEPIDVTQPTPPTTVTKELRDDPMADAEEIREKARSRNG